MNKSLRFVAMFLVPVFVLQSIPTAAFAEEIVDSIEDVVVSEVAPLVDAPAVEETGATEDTTDVSKKEEKKSVLVEEVRTLAVSNNNNTPISTGVSVNNQSASVTTNFTELSDIVITESVAGDIKEGEISIKVLGEYQLDTLAPLDVKSIAINELSCKGNGQGESNEIKLKTPNNPVELKTATSLSFSIQSSSKSNNNKDCTSKIVISGLKVKAISNLSLPGKITVSGIALTKSFDAVNLSVSQESIPSSAEIFVSSTTPVLGTTVNLSIVIKNQFGSYIADGYTPIVLATVPGVLTNLTTTVGGTSTATLSSAATGTISFSVAGLTLDTTNGVSSVTFVAPTVDGGNNGGGEPETPYASSTDSSLSDLSVWLNDVNLLSSFASSTFNYFVNLPFGSNGTPLVFATTTHNAASKVITAAAISTDTTNRVSTSTVHVVAENGIVSSTYSIIFTVLPNQEEVDTIAPVITLNGSSIVTVTKGTVYVDAGFFSAIDNVDGDVSEDVVVVTDVDTSIVGEYVVIFAVSDSSENIGYAVRTVNVVEAEIVDGEEPTGETPTTTPTTTTKRRGGGSSRPRTNDATTTATTTITTPVILNSVAPVVTSVTTQGTQSGNNEATVATFASATTSTTTPEIVLANNTSNDEITGQAAAVGSAFGGTFSKIMWILGILMLLLLGYFTYRSLRKQN